MREIVRNEDLQLVSGPVFHLAIENSWIHCLNSALDPAKEMPSKSAIWMMLSTIIDPMLWACTLLSSEWCWADNAICLSFFSNFFLLFFSCANLVWEGILSSNLDGKIGPEQEDETRVINEEEVDLVLWMRGPNLLEVGICFLVEVTKRRP